MVDRTAGTHGDASVMAYAPPVSIPRRQSSDIARGKNRTGISTRLRSSELIRGIIASVLTLAYLAVLLTMLNLSIGHVSLGFEAQQAADGRWVVTWVMPASVSYDAGVRPGDVVRALNGTALTADTRPVTQNGAISEARQADFESPDGRLISLTTQDKEGGDPFNRWAYALLGLVFVGVGGPVFIKATQRSAAIAFYVFCLTTAFALAIYIGGTSFRNWVLALMFTSLILWSASFVIFFFTFPTWLGNTRTRQIIIIAGIIGSAGAMLAGYLWVLSGHLSDYVWVLPLANFYMAGCVGAGLMRLSWSLVTERSRAIRQQLILLLIGTALAVGPTLLLSVLPRLLFDRQIVRGDISALALIILPLAFAYAITQHQLLGIRNFIRRSVVYVIMGSVVLMVFSMAAALLSTFLSSDWTRQELGLIGFGFFVFFIALSFGYVQRRVERLVDRYIYHDAYDYKEALLEFSTQLAAEQDLRLLAEQLVERTCRLMNLTCGVLLLAVRPDEEPGASVLDGINGRRSHIITTLELSDTRLTTTPDGLHSEQIQEDTQEQTQGQARSELQLQEYLPAPSATEPQADAVEHLVHNANVRHAANNHPYLVTVARYGEYADWLIYGLEAELNRLGISLQDADTDSPAHLIYVNEMHTLQTDKLPDEEGVPVGRTLHTVPLRNPYEPHGSDQVMRHVQRATTLTQGSGRAGSNGARPASPEGVRSFLGVPLWTRSRFVGMLCLGGKKTGERFTRDDLALLSTLGSQAALAIYNAQLYEMREQALLDTITALAHAIEAKDNYTINHCEKITGRAVALAQAMALPQQEIENIRLGSILHDVGKIGIPDAILNKPGRLTGEEYEIIKQHAVIGARIVQSVGALHDVAPIVRHHQERYDGSGYPDGLSGEDIPLGARIIAVVDAYGAMTEDRVYRKALGHHRAIEELKRCAGTQFDPMIVEAFIRLLEDRPDLAER